MENDLQMLVDKEIADLRQQLAERDKTIESLRTVISDAEFSMSEAINGLYRGYMKEVENTLRKDVARIRGTKLGTPEAWKLAESYHNLSRVVRLLPLNLEWLRRPTRQHSHEQVSVQYLIEIAEILKEIDG